MRSLPNGILTGVVYMDPSRKAQAAHPGADYTLMDTRLSRWFEGNPNARHWAEVFGLDWATQPGLTERLYRLVSRTSTGRLRNILGSSNKVAKSKDLLAIWTKVVYRAMNKVSGVPECPNATPGCVLLCLGSTSGHLAGGNRAETVQRKAMVLKSWYRFWFPEAWNARLGLELERHERKAIAAGYQPAVRLDGTSDTGDAQHWAPLFPGVQFYDYTKDRKRAMANADGLHAPNYRLTYSLNEHPHSLGVALMIVERGGVAAMVVRNKAQAAALVKAGTYHSYPVIDGDEHDARYTESGCWSVLYNKAGNKVDPFGFIIDTEA